ncbi:MAG TPA: hypothetical protein VJ719_16350 [Chthoniobacterales bacterium]|nr:hypothetical protein [Chthoniobacterales bacterium]
MMAPFDYLSVLVSIVLGLGIAQLLSGFGRWLEQRATLRPYLPAIAWAAFLLIVHVQTWWSMFGLRHWATWTFLQFSLVLLQPVILYLMTVLIFPSATSAEVDMRANFHLQRPWLFSLLLLLLVVSVLKDFARAGKFPDGANLVFHGVLLVMGIAGLATRREVVQGLLAGTALVVIVAYIILLFADLT